MSPVTKATTNIKVDTSKSTIIIDDETDEGFVSPSVKRILTRKESATNVSNSASDNDSQTDSSSPGGSSHSQTVPSSSDDDDIETVPPKEKNGEGGKKEIGANNKLTTNAPSSNPNNSLPTNRPSKDVNNVPTNRPTKDAAASDKAESLAQFIVSTLLVQGDGNSSDKVERTLFRVVRVMMTKHEILFKGMMRRLQFTRETGYISFVTVADTLFEEEKRVITWSRIVALYAFGGQLALYCKENNMEDFTDTVAMFMGKYSKEVLTPYVTNNLGGWEKICEEFPDESDIENKIRRLLSWTAVGLGVAATVSYLTSR